jgi:hypothetical protein
MTTVPLYSAIASLLATIERCDADGNTEWRDHHRNTLDAMLKEHLPSGSGLDAGVKLAKDECKSNKLVFNTSFHHMNEHGVYAGWTDHQVVVTPSLEYGAVLKISGIDRNGIKDYLADLFHQVMFVQVNPYDFQKVKIEAAS